MSVWDLGLALADRHPVLYVCTLVAFVMVSACLSEWRPFSRRYFVPASEKKE